MLRVTSEEFKPGYVKTIKSKKDEIKNNLDYDAFCSGFHYQLRKRR